MRKTSRTKVFLGICLVQLCNSKNTLKVIPKYKCEKNREQRKNINNK